MTKLDELLERAQPGSRRAVQVHIRRGRAIAACIEQRWGAIGPRQWRLKHVRWYLEVAAADLSAPTQYDHWRTVRVIIAAIGRLTDWAPRLHGSWQHRTGKPGQGSGGRPPKLVHSARR
jgi:hypothetical protein